MNNKNLGKILIAMGFTTIITTIIDYYTILFPLNLRSKEWVFSITQGLADLSIMPVLGMIFLLVGLNLAREKKNEAFFKNIEKGTAILSILFAVGFAGCTVLYGISAPGVESKIVDNLKAQNSAAKEKLESVYEKYKEKVDEKKYNTVLENLDTRMMLQINQTSSGIVKTTFKTILTLGFFSLLHLYIFLNIFELFDFIKHRVFKIKRKPVSI